MGGRLKLQVAIIIFLYLQLLRAKSFTLQLGVFIWTFIKSHYSCFRKIEEYTSLILNKVISTCKLQLVSLFQLIIFLRFLLPEKFIVAPELYRLSEM